ncbi:MAG TPA: Mrp/NBP35 family ATP-binding protein [Acidimicrobiales bacterium]|nr:Mrp/NBP35 family ATP-binding protein [Acidimicrobiales bacterium]
MALTPDTVLDALRPVQDPEIQRSIVDLDMVRGIAIDGGTVHVGVALTVAGCPLRTEITNRVTQAVIALPGVHAVDVDLTVMTDEERAALRAKLQGGTSGHQPQAMGHAEGAAIPSTTAGPNTRIIGIASGKGGVGKSSVTVNLAVALAQRGSSVGVLDADVYGFSVPKMLGIDQDPMQIDGMIIPPVGYGVKCMSVGMLVEDDETPVMWRGPMLHKLLEEFLTKVLWDAPEYLLFDMPPGTGDVALSMHNYLPQAELIVVTTPQPAAQRVAQRSGTMAGKIGTPLMGVVENMSWFTGDDGHRYELFGSGGGQLLADKLGVPLIGQVPFVPALREGGDVGVPIVVSDPGGEVAAALESIAGWVAARGPKRRFRPELTIR